MFFDVFVVFVVITDICWEYVYAILPDDGDRVNVFNSLINMFHDITLNSFDFVLWNVLNAGNNLNALCRCCMNVAVCFDYLIFRMAQECCSH